MGRSLASRRVTRWSESDSSVKCPHVSVPLHLTSLSLLLLLFSARECRCVVCGVLGTVKQLKQFAEMLFFPFTHTRNTERLLWSILISHCPSFPAYSSLLFLLSHPESCLWGTCSSILTVAHQWSAAMPTPHCSSDLRRRLFFCRIMKADERGSDSVIKAGLVLPRAGLHGIQGFGFLLGLVSRPALHAHTNTHSHLCA